MSRTASTFKQADVTRAIRAAVAAGVPLDSVRVKINLHSGEIEISTNGSRPAEAEAVEQQGEIVL